MVDFPSKAHYTVDDLRRLVEVLRGEGGCPWDREQTHASLRRGMLEEACELCEAIDEGDALHLREELGDVLLQVIFHASIEREKGSFDLDEVADAECRKLILRHPHVFGAVQVTDSAEVLRNWEDIKRAEKAQTTASQAMDGVCRTLPALWRAEKIQKKAARAGFDWADISGALAKLREETGELEQAAAARDADNIAEELGDLLFCAVNVARFAGQDPEAVLHLACEKYIRRFRFMEDRAREDGRELDKLPPAQMAEYYQLARMALENKEPPEGFAFTTVTPPAR